MEKAARVIGQALRFACCTFMPVAFSHDVAPLPMARSSICCRVMTLVDCGVSLRQHQPLADRIHRRCRALVAPRSLREVPASNASTLPARHGCPCRPGLRPSARAGSNDSSLGLPPRRPAPRPAGQPAHWPGRAARGGRGRLCMAWAASAAPANAAMTSATPVSCARRAMEGSGRQGHIVGFQAKKIEASPVCQSKRKSDSPACVFRLCRAARPNSGYSAAPAPARRARQRPAHDRCPPGKDPEMRRPATAGSQARPRR